MPPNPLRARTACCLVAGFAVAGTTAAGCAGQAATGGPVQAYVVQRYAPRGLIVSAATADGTLALERVPADLAGGDAVTSVDGFPCEVLAVDLPRGTVVRRSQVVPATKLGLDHGYAPGSVLPPGC